MSININNLTSVRREYPNWATRARIKKVGEDGTVLEGQHAFNGELIRVSPRFQRNGQNFRVRPERSGAFFAAFLYEFGVLPELLTAQECEAEWALELLDPLWEQFKGSFPSLGSPFAASDTSTVPSHRVGFSFNILQLLVEPMGTVRGPASRPTAPALTNGNGNSPFLESFRKKIEERRAQEAASGDQPAARPPLPKPKKKPAHRGESSGKTEALEGAEGPQEDGVKGSDLTLPDSTSPEAPLTTE